MRFAAPEIGDSRPEFVQIPGLSELPEISTWQAGKDSLNDALPGVLAVAGTSVLAFRKPDTIGDHSFQDIRMDYSKGREAVVSKECG